ncbi:MAG: sigma-70 family RNA polymerase sigma factor [Gemmataceae bacterium]|nr:sigma-70 family RNA polymerase sigma factor [Gemmataceae bacterium]MCI0743401.1 sigma-70 family RNA polymerase sigma factor [Gemmataceae bacterium]
MDQSSPTQTSATLLGRLRRAPTDLAAWNEFVERYGPQIQHWCRQWRLQEADAQDLTQTVLLKLAETMGSFAYDPERSFRGWLRTVTHNAWIKLAERARRAIGGSGDTCIDELLQTVAARDDLVVRLEEEFDRELLDEAVQRIRARVEPRTWDAFRLMALEGRSGAEAASQLAMKVATVFVAKSKVQKMLQAELLKLEDDA